MTDLQVIFDYDSVDETPIYYRYAWQGECQDAYIEIDIEDETIDADWDGQIGGGSPQRVWHGIARRYSVSPWMSKDDVKALIEEIKPHAKMLIENASTKWDGDNEVAVFNDEAHRLDELIRDLCHDTKTVNYVVFSGLDWISAYGDTREAAKELLEQHDGDTAKALCACIDEATKNCIRLVEMDELEKLLESIKDEENGEDE